MEATAAPALTAPQNLDAEEHVLGAMLLTKAAVERALEVLEPEGARKFYRRSNGTIYLAIRSLRLDNAPADVVTVAARLERMGQLVEIGGSARINEIAATVPAASNVAHWAELVHEQWAKRGVLRALEETRTKLLLGASAADCLSEAERRLLEVRGLVEMGRESRISSARQAVAEFEAQVASPPSPDGGIGAPFTFVPRMWGGRLYVLAGYTADGKTTLAAQFLRASCKQGARVGFISLEMSTADLMDRLVSSYGIPYRQVQSKQFDPRFEERKRDALAELKEMQFEIVDDAGADSAAINRYTQVGGYDFLIIDHLHRFDWADRRQLEREVRGLTNLARMKDIPVLLLAQLSRSKSDKPFPRPSLASLRETAVIEQEAWMVSFIYRLRDKDSNNPTEVAEWIVAKNRSGPLGITPLFFDSTQVRYMLPEEP